MKVFSFELDLLPQSVWHFFSATPEAKNNLVFLQEIGHYFTQEKYFTTRQGLESFLVAVSVSGGGILEYNDHTIKVGVGQFFWIDCMERQHYHTDPDIGHWEVMWVHFNGITARAYYKAYRESQNGIPVKTIPDGSPIQSILETLIARIASGEYKGLLRYGINEDIHISSVLTQLMVACCSPIESYEGRPTYIPPIIQSIRGFLNENFDRKITLENLASKYNLDPFYLQKQFKRYIGRSPSQYVIYLRMTQAKIMMRTTNRSINEIAAIVGIDNTSLFIRQFRKHEGKNPLQYRKDWSTHPHSVPL